MPNSSGPFNGQRPDSGIAHEASDADSPARSRPNYEQWHAEPDGKYAMDAQHLLLRHMIAGWPRRGHNMLELFCGSGRFLENLWEAGFDMTGQEHDQGLVRQARRRLGNRVSITLNRPEHLPFDDQSFDYVACINGLEFAEQPEAVLEECFRLASLGLILAFPGSFSLHGLGLRLRNALEGKSLKNIFSRQSAPGATPAGDNSCGSEKSPDRALSGRGLIYGEPRQFSPLRVMQLARRFAPHARFSWGSILIGPAGGWKQGGICGKLNMLPLPLPIGACVMLRIDFAPAYSGTLLPLAATPEKQTAKAAMAKEGLAKESLPKEGMG